MKHGGSQFACKCILLARMVRADERDAPWKPIEHSVSEAQGRRRDAMAQFTTRLEILIEGYLSKRDNDTNFLKQAKLF
jgi:hypothetical protein